MKLVNEFNNMLHVSEPAADLGGKGPIRFKSTTLWSWSPFVLLAATVMVCTLIGAPNNGWDEVDWLSRLANSGDAGAQLQLGLAYRDGRYGLNPDARTGLYWLKKSAASGNAYAEKAIGTAYANGRGANQSIPLAEQWYRKAIKDGDRSARVLLADMLIRTGETSEGNQLLM